MKRVYIPKADFAEFIIAPSYQDVAVGQTPFYSSLSLWTMRDDVAAREPLITLRHGQNILQRRDASCDLIYKKLFNSDVREITVDKLYAATNLCQNEFYQGALENWSNGEVDVFGERITPWFIGAYRTDMLTNGYFGDITRIETGTEKYSTNKYDGVFKWISTYAAAGIIPATQLLAAPNTNLKLNPADAHAMFDSAIAAQSAEMAAFAPYEKMFIVSRPVMEGLKRYLRSIGSADILNLIGLYTNGVQLYSYDGIEVYVEPIWEPVLREIQPAKEPNALILTLKGNFVFGTDKDYGEGPKKDQALAVWYSWDELSWKYRAFLKAGTQIALPEYVVAII